MSNLPDSTFLSLAAHFIQFGTNDFHSKNDFRLIFALLLAKRTLVFTAILTQKLCAWNTKHHFDIRPWVSFTFLADQFISKSHHDFKIDIFVKLLHFSKTWLANMPNPDGMNNRSWINHSTYGQWGKLMTHICLGTKWRSYPGWGGKWERVRDRPFILCPNKYESSAFLTVRKCCGM